MCAPTRQVICEVDGRSESAPTYSRTFHRDRRADDIRPYKYSIHICIATKRAHNVRPYSGSRYNICKAWSDVSIAPYNLIPKKRSQGKADKRQ